MFKIISGILLILVVPVLFFQLLGVNPVVIDKPHKRVIAVVNEDLGQTKDDENVEMGKEAIAILAEDSQYEWKVMGRGSAINGLKSNQYDGVVYIPSDFSQNVMSYDQQNPQKAEFAYQVSRQKTGASKEKVLREIDLATNRVNSKVSTLYWSYVAQEMDHIKKEFHNILGTETEFLNAMSTYYKPESEVLVTDIQKQSEQMEGLRASIVDADQDHHSRVDSTEAFGKQMGQFISYVDEYKDFQQQQKKILQQVQDDSLAKIHAVASTQSEQFNQSLQALKDNEKKVKGDLTKVNEKIEKNQQKFNELSTLRKSEVKRQLSDLLVVQSTAIDRYNDSILRNLEKGMGAGNNTPPGAPALPPDENELTRIQKAMERIADAKLDPGLGSSDNVNTGLTSIHSSLTTMKQEVELADPTSPLLVEIDKLLTGLTTVKVNVADKKTLWLNTFKADAADYADASNNFSTLFGSYKKVYADYEALLAKVDAEPADVSKILFEIEKLENALLARTDLNDAHRDRLQTLFNKGAANNDVDNLLSYYSTLLQYEFTLEERAKGTQRDKLLKDDILNTLLKDAVKQNDVELDGWVAVENGMPETKFGMSELSTTFAAIVSGHEKTVAEQHTALISDLDKINEQANLLLTQISAPTTLLPQKEPVRENAKEQVVSGQQNVSNQLLTLTGMVNSLSDRQGNLFDYTSDLFAKANDIKDTSNTFSKKWNSNLGEMSAFNKDIQGFLANTYVDGQENGYVFNHYVNPLNVKGEAVMEEEVKKVPPVILFLIILVSSLLIGFFGHRLQNSSAMLRIVMTGLLSVLVGVIISLYSINMYILNDGRAVEWTVFTILLLLASAAVVHASLDFSQASGWIAAVGLMCLYIAPLLILGVPELAIPDVLSTVYMSIKYEAETSFMLGATFAGVIAVTMFVISWVISKYKGNRVAKGEEIYEG